MTAAATAAATAPATTRAPRSPWWTPWAWMVGGALLHAAAFPPIGAWPLAVVAVAPWVIALHGASPAQAAFRSWVYGTLVYVFGCAWLVAVHPIALVLLPPVASLLFWLPMGPLLVWWRRRLGAPAVAVVPVVWLVSEWFRLQWPIGFSYLCVGHALADAPVLAQVAAVGGAAACTLLCAGVGALLADRWAARQGFAGAPGGRALRAGTLAVVGTWGGAFLYGIVTYRSAFTPGPIVAGVQANIALLEKHTRSVPITDRHEALSRAVVRVAGTPPALLCWPETMAEPLSCAAGSLGRMQSLARELRCPLLVGTVASGFAAGVATPQRWNSAMLFDARGALVDRYDKHRLVVPTETLPTQTLWPVSERILVALAGGVPDFAPGTGTGVLAVPGAPDLRVGVAICYEVASGALTRASVRDGATVLVNLTNEAWFPNSSQFAQLWQQCRLRCIETRTPMVRVANTGWSGCIAANGTDTLVLSENHGGEAGEHFHLPVPIDGRPTLFLWLGDWLSVLALLAALGLSVAAWHRGP